MIALKSRSIPILFFANKMDLDGMKPSDISNALSLETIKDRNWTIWYTFHSRLIQISATNALTGEGIEGGLDWLVDQLEYNRT